MNLRKTCIFEYIFDLSHVLMMFILLKFIKTSLMNIINSRKFTLVMKNSYFFKLAYSLNFLNFSRIYFT